MDAGLTVRIGNPGRVAHQAAGNDAFAPVMGRGNPVSGCRRDDPSLVGAHEGLAIQKWD
jgi:hypothetical protein